MLFQRDPDLNYTWISVVYSIASVVAAFMYCIENYGSRPQKNWVAQMNGMYIAFVPYVPCLLWIIVLQIIRQKSSGPTMRDTKKNNW